MHLPPLTRKPAARSALVVAGAALIALALAACGGGGSSDSSASSMPASGETVSTKSISGFGDVLVDSQGAALYSNDMDRGSKVVCTGACTADWIPLAAPSNGQPSASDGALQAKLGTIERSDGTTQVTFDGKPLYSFVQDRPGEVTGNGFNDSFDGTTFTWTVATVAGAGSGSSGTTGTSSSGGGSGGGYGY